jgi:hypothetical protein
MCWIPHIFTPQVGVATSPITRMRNFADGQRQSRVADTNRGSTLW